MRIYPEFRNPAVSSGEFLYVMRQVVLRSFHKEARMAKQTVKPKEKSYLKLVVNHSPAPVRYTIPITARR